MHDWQEQCIPKTPFLGSRSRGSIQHRPYAAQNSSTSSTDAGDEAISSSSGNSALQSIGLTAAVMGLGVLNRVLYKMALVPLGDYVFFLAQFQTFGCGPALHALHHACGSQLQHACAGAGACMASRECTNELHNTCRYVVVYFSALAIRYRAGIVTKDMLAAPNKKLFLWIGALEALSQLLGFIGASKLPGVVLPLLQQSMLLWQVALAYLVLNKRLAPVQARRSSARAELGPCGSACMGWSVEYARTGIAAASGMAEAARGLRCLDWRRAAGHCGRPDGRLAGRWRLQHLHRGMHSSVLSGGCMMHQGLGADQARAHAPDEPAVRQRVCGEHALPRAGDHLQGEDLHRRQAEAGRQAAGHLRGACLRAWVVHTVFGPFAPPAPWQPPQLHWDAGCMPARLRPVKSN